MLKRWMPWWAVALIVVMAIGTVWLRLAIVRTTYSISQTDRAIRELQQAREQMELKVTALRSPRRLEVLAKTKFGLSQPKAEQIVHMQGRLPEGSESSIEDGIRVAQAAPAPPALSGAPAPVTPVIKEAPPAAKHPAVATAAAKKHVRAEKKPRKHSAVTTHARVTPRNPWKLAKRLIHEDSGAQRGHSKK